MQRTGDDERRLDVARLTSQWIKQAGIEEIKQALRYAMMKIGLRDQNWPSEEEKILMIDHITANFGGHAIDEIRLAFDMAIAGKLNVEVNCYENFSCLYFSSIMNAYRSWAVAAHKMIKNKDVQKLYTDEEITNIRRGEIETAFQAMKQGKMPIVFPYWYEVLKSDEMLQEGENLDEFFVRKLNGNAENIYTKN